MFGISDLGFRFKFSGFWRLGCIPNEVEIGMT